jgi:glycosyltransferase involved in cell wall biosynthesis
MQRAPSGGDVYDLQLIAALKRTGHDAELIHTSGRAAPERMAQQLLAACYDAVVQDELGHAEYKALNGALAGRLPVFALIHVTGAELDPEAGSASKERAYLESVQGAIFVSRHVRRRTQQLLAPRPVRRRGRRAKRTSVVRGIVHRAERADCDDGDPAVHPGAGEIEARRPASAYGARSLVLLPGVDHLAANRRPTPNAPKQLSAEDPRAATRPLRFLCVGHLLPHKGQLELVELFAQLPGPTLTLAGDPTRDRAYARRVRLAAAPLGSRVRLPGALTPRALAAAFARTDVCVSASRYESYGLGLAEAVAHGLPVVAWTVGGLWEFLRPGIDAVRVPPGNKRAFAAALERLCVDPTSLAKLQRGARESARRGHTWDEAAALLAAWISRQLRAAGRARR